MLMSVSLIHCHCRFLYIQTSWYFLWFKYNHQKAESWRAASLSKLGNNSLIFNKGIFHFPAPWLSYNHLYNTHQIPFFTVTISHLQFHLTICLTIPSILPMLPSSHLSTCLCSYSTVLPKIVFPTAVFQPIQAATKNQWVRNYCEEWHCFNLFLLPWSINRNKSTHNYWSHIAQANEDMWYQNRKPITRTSPISSTSCHYFLP